MIQLTQMANVVAKCQPYYFELSVSKENECKTSLKSEHFTITGNMRNFARNCSIGSKIGGGVLSSVLNNLSNSKRYNHHFEQSDAAFGERVKTVKSADFTLNYLDREKLPDNAASIMS